MSRLGFEFTRGAYRKLGLLLSLLLFSVAAHAHVCAANTNGRTAICGEAAGKCFYQAAFSAPTSGPHQISNADSVCCYDPNVQECGAGAAYKKDTYITPVVTAKREYVTTSLGQDLKACGLVAIHESDFCTLQQSCSVVGYTSMCPTSLGCTNDVSICPENVGGSSSCSTGHSCGGVCYDAQTNFCYNHTIYDKDTHFKCGDGVYEKSPSRACCSNQTLYDPRSEGCSSGLVYNLATQGVCGSHRFDKATEGCCGNTVYDLTSQTCSHTHVVHAGHQWSEKCDREYDPQTHECQKGKPPFPSYEMCKIGESYALNRCYTPGSAGMGEACAANDQCAHGKCNGMEGLSRGTCVCQANSDCGSNAICKHGALGIGQNKCVATAAPTCPSGWSYEERNPLNKDRCTRTVTSTASPVCKLAITDKAKNWTGPHAQAGEDECRSVKGKDPKGVKCTGSFHLDVQQGADICTKETVEHQTPACPDGWDYKSQQGKDLCQQK